MTVYAHSHAHKHQICHFILLWLLKRGSNYEGQVRGRGRAADWAESGQARFRDTLKRNGDRELNRQWGVAVVCMEREKGEEEGGYTGVPRFMALTSASFSTRCSQPVCHEPHPPTLLLLSPSPSLVGCEIGKETVGGGHGAKQIPFPWTLCCARHVETHLRMKGRLM